MTDHKMNPELKKKWLRALRGDYYHQTRGALMSRYSGGFCCLGVLADVAGVLDRESGCVRGAEHDLGNWPREEVPYPFPSFDKDGFVADTEAVLIGLNDDERKSFDEIADWIEENL